MTATDQNSTLTERLEKLRKINRSRLDYVLARCDTESVDATLKKIGRSKGWYYGFSEEERAELEQLASELHYEKTIQAFLLLQEAATEAARVKIKGLVSNDQRVRQAAATEILDRSIGKPGDNLNVTGNLGVTLVWQPHKPPSAGES